MVYMKGFKLNLLNKVYSVCRDKLFPENAAVLKGGFYEWEKDCRRLKYENWDDILQFFLKIDYTIDAIDLSENDLGLQKIILLDDLFKSIPKNLVFLNLSRNRLGNLKNIFFPFSRLSANIIYLDLSRNGLKQQCKADLRLLFENFPEELDYLSLAWNELNSVSAETLAYSFKGIKKKLLYLDLKYNNFGFKTAKELKEIFSSIPAFTVNLSSNNLGNKTKVELIEAFESFPPHVHYLDLSSNEFDDKLEALASSLSVISPNIYALRLGNIALGFAKDEDIITLFESLTEIYSLDLTKNSLEKFSSSCLERLKHLLPKLEEIYLSFEEVQKMTSVTRQAFSQIFPNIKKVVLINEIGKIVTNEDKPLNAIFCRELGSKTEIPSLACLCGFFLKNKEKTHVESLAIPIELKEFINELNIS